MKTNTLPPVDTDDISPTEESQITAQQLQILKDQREDFVATLSHDLKDPISAANRALELILDGAFGPLQDTQQSVLQTICESNRTIQEHLNALLEVYDYEGGAKQLSLKCHDLRQSLKAILLELVPVASSANVTIQGILPSRIKPIECDLPKICRIVQSLIDNAVQHTPSGGQILVEIEQSPEATTIAVRNTGRGITEEDQKNLFRRFRTPTNSGCSYTATGLQLYLSRLIVELHNGEIWCESKDGSGCAFLFRIPNGHNHKES